MESSNIKKAKELFVDNFDLFCQVTEVKMENLLIYNLRKKGLSINQIAHRMGKPKSTIQSILKRISI